MAEPDREHDSVLARHAALAVVTHLRGQGHEACFAGGCVRDELLGLRPGDYDVATDATPDRLEGLFRGARLVGAKFGVVQVRTLGVWTEVATFRSDGSYSDSRRPDEVTFSDPQSDAERRDFTINALFLDPLADRIDWTKRPGGGVVEGRVIDLVGGLADLDAGVLRAVGDPHRRLAEDHLRALRAVRFAARLGFEIEPQTAHAIAQHAGQLEGISRERIGGELRRMLTHPTRARSASIMEMLGLDAFALHEAHHGAGTGHLRLSSLPATAGTPLSLAAWELDRGHGLHAAEVAPTAARLRAALCLSNEEHTAIVDCLNRRLAILEGFDELNKARQKRLAASAGFESALSIVEAEAPGISLTVRRRVSELASEPGGLTPGRWVTGADLLDAGWEPGPVFARVLESLYDLQLAGDAADRAALLEHLASLGVKEQGPGRAQGADSNENRINPG
jgi:tRNA nucleotidyltransferase/poly(A) polymerase